MKVILDGLNLSVAVNNVSKAISGRTTNPILEGIKLTAAKGHLILTATDLEISIEEKIPAEVLIEGEVVVPGKYFSDFIKKLTNCQIELSLISEGSLKIVYNDSEGVLQTLRKDEFPSFDRIQYGESFSLAQKEMRDLINKCVFCASTEDTRPILKGVLFEIDEYSVTAVALDGYRLALVKKAIENTSNKMNVIIPARTLNEISKIMGDDDSIITIHIEKNKLMIEIGRITLISRLFEGDFILYKNIIPKEFVTSVNFNKEELESALDRASVLSRGNKNNLVSFDVKDKTAHLISNSEIGNINEKLNLSLIGNEIAISFNPKYITDALKVIDEDFITFKLNTNTSPAIITPMNSDEILYMVLPIRTA